MQLISRMIEISFPEQNVTQKWLCTWGVVTLLRHHKYKHLYLNKSRQEEGLHSQTHLPGLLLRPLLELVLCFGSFIPAPSQSRQEEGLHSQTHRPGLLLRPLLELVLCFGSFIPAPSQPTRPTLPPYGLHCHAKRKGYTAKHTGQGSFLGLY